MLEIGKLLVNVFNIGIGMPLNGAMIRIFASGSSSIIAESFTDSSGKSSELWLPCPSAEYSLNYVEGAPKPYAKYDLKITKDGFVPVSVLGLELLSGTTAIQNISMLPSGGHSYQTQTIMVPDHALYSGSMAKLPENEVKPLPPPSGQVVLDKPVIPEIIVVHNGLPNDSSAINYYVPFKDYIKNVACCEIYPTWPESTIKANVLAIISFTLNRVFTEWYRGQGKNFTITNSTAYDQAFLYGRNIFQEISAIADEFFTTYITKPNILQPLFTQYCDGRQVQCPSWMSQWGSKDLGDKGYSYLNILKNYYGQNVYLEKAKKVSGIPASFPGHNLQTGSVGNSVKTIQSQLNVISNSYPAIPKAIEDGIYGTKTGESVKAFQKIFDMPQSGIVDFSTWYKISHIYAAVKKLAELA